MLKTLNLKKRKQHGFIRCNIDTRAHTCTQVSNGLTQAAVAKILPQTDVAELIGSDPPHLQSYCCVITLQIQRTADRVNLQNQYRHLQTHAIQVLYTWLYIDNVLKISLFSFRITKKLTWEKRNEKRKEITRSFVGSSMLCEAALMASGDWASSAS